MPARYVAAVVVGNALEFYDFLTFSFFAVYIGRTFFPSSDPSASLLASLATFGAGFVTRPIGTFVIGRMGDRVGRRPAMILSFWLMGVAILAVIYAVSIALFGGTTQYSITWLSRATGNPLAPAWYWTAALALGIAAMCVVRDSALRTIAVPVKLPASGLEVSQQYVE